MHSPNTFDSLQMPSNNLVIIIYIRFVNLANKFAVECTNTSAPDGKNINATTKTKQPFKSTFAQLAIV